tara:strand:+ start:387 stop:641 length:255 start_codon:yes stop_codon:yes gene_type:complete
MTSGTKATGGTVRKQRVYVVRRYYDQDGHTARETVADCATTTQAHIVARRLSRQRNDGVFNVKNRQSHVIAPDCIVLTEADQEP